MIDSEGGTTIALAVNVIIIGSILEGDGFVVQNQNSRLLRRIEQ